MYVQDREIGPAQHRGAGAALRKDSAAPATSPSTEQPRPLLDPKVTHYMVGEVVGARGASLGGPYGAVVKALCRRR